MFQFHPAPLVGAGRPKVPIGDPSVPIARARQGRGGPLQQRSSADGRRCRYHLRQIFLRDRRLGQHGGGCDASDSATESMHDATQFTSKEGSRCRLGSVPCILTDIQVSTNARACTPTCTDKRRVTRNTKPPHTQQARPTSTKTGTTTYATRKARHLVRPPAEPRCWARTSGGGSASRESVLRTAGGRPHWLMMTNRIFFQS